MSVTFHCPDAPRTEEVCEWCARARQDRDDQSALDGEWVAVDAVLSDEDWARVTCDPWCSGTRRVSTAPETNLANSNARGILDLIGLGDDRCGCVATEDIPDVLRRIMGAMNRDSSRAHLITGMRDERGDPRIVTDPDTGLPPSAVGAGSSSAGTPMRRPSVVWRRCARCSSTPISTGSVSPGDDQLI